MHARAVPNRPTSSSRRAVQRVRHGRRQATSATAALAARSQESPAAGIDAKSRTATADPRYCEIAPRTKSVCGGILASRSMGDCVRATTGILPSVNVLVLAASPIDASLLRRELGDEVEGAQVLVVSPAVNSSPLAFWVSDSDEAIEDAQERLDETLDGAAGRRRAGARDDRRQRGDRRHPGRPRVLPGGSRRRGRRPRRGRRGVRAPRRPRDRRFSPRSRARPAGRSGRR